MQFVEVSTYNMFSSVNLLEYESILKRLLKFVLFMNLYLRILFLSSFQLVLDCLLFRYLLTRSRQQTSNIRMLAYKRLSLKVKPLVLTPIEVIN